MFFFNITGHMATNEEKSHPASNNDGNERDVNEIGTSNSYCVYVFILCLCYLNFIWCLCSLILQVKWLLIMMEKNQPVTRRMILDEV